MKCKQRAEIHNRNDRNVNKQLKLKCKQTAEIHN